VASPTVLCKFDFHTRLRHTPFRERCALATRLKPSGKNETGEYANFETALKKALSVPHSEIRAELEAEKRKKAKSSSSRVSSSKR
jgi:hypothetical protein